MTGAPRAPAGGLRGLGRFLEIQNLGLNLPFALAFLAWAMSEAPSLRAFILVVVAFVAARNAGHSFNRWADRSLDAANPRTQDRALVVGTYSPAFALGLAVANGVLVLAAAVLLNPLAALLGPVALALVFGYSYTKRFTSLTTVFLGLVEAVVPAAVFIAFTGTLPASVLLAVGALLLWGTAFEIVHSLGDWESDRSLGLRSIPVRLGPRRSLALMSVLHAAALVLFALFGLAKGIGWGYFVGVGAMAIVTGYLDTVLHRDPQRTSLVFRGHFVLSSIYLAGTLAGLFLGLV